MFLDGSASQSDLIKVISKYDILDSVFSRGKKVKSSSEISFIFDLIIT